MILLTAALIATTLLGIIIFYLFLVPMNRVKSLEDVGYAHLDGRRLIRRARRARRPGNVPPVFPNGWFVVAESRQVPIGVVKYVSALGMELAVFRGRDSNEVFITDVYCPHLGANMAMGKVKGDCLECPFHEWKFSGQSGKCIDIPYLKEGKIPEFAKVSTHQCQEVNGLIFIWHHAEGSDPHWYPDALPQLNSNCNGTQWVYQGRNEYEIACHIEDVPENGSDVAHLPAVHRTSIMMGGEPSEWQDLATSGWAWHEWTGLNWRPETEEGRKHRAVVTLKHGLKMGKQWEVLSIDVKGEQIGPGMVYLHFDCRFLGRGVMLQYVLPLEPMLQRIVHVFYTEPGWLAPLAKLVIYGESVLLERDIRVWNSKTYLDRPLLVKEDHLVQKHRRWYSQFYSKNSPKLQDFRDRKLDW